MGTDKRARQKAGRQARLEALQASQTKAKRKSTALRLTIALVAFLALAFVLSRVVGGGDDNKDAKNGFAYGDGDCPPVPYTGAPVKTFTSAPKLCIDPSKAYTATFDTTEGAITVALDTERTPGTTNNFVTLARWGYYDGTTIFRTDPSIDIIQGGGKTNTDSPGYTIPDEGGAFTYQPGDLVMARSSQPNSAGGQFFFGAGPKVSSLGSTGTYVTFGTVEAGEDVVEAILALNQSNGGPLGGAPSRTVTVNSVEITEQ